MTSPALDALTGSAVFADVPIPELAALAALAVEERFAVPTRLAERGDQPPRLWRVMEGSVEIGLFSESGRTAQLAPILPGGWATWLACFHQAPLPHDLWTGHDTRLLAFPAQAVRNLAARNPQIYPHLVARIGERMRDLIGWALAASLSDPERRLAYLLIVTARDSGEGPDDPVVLPLTQERLAATGLGSRQRVARLLSGLARRGLVECGYGVVRIPSRQKLEAFVMV
jgi:CRP-like cAMP-binding protein